MFDSGHCLTALEHGLVIHARGGPLDAEHFFRQMLGLSCIERDLFTFVQEKPRVIDDMVAFLCWLSLPFPVVDQFQATESFHGSSLIEQCRERRLYFAALLDLNRDASDDAAVFGFDVHTPVPGVKALLEGIGSIAAFTST